MAMSDRPAKDAIFADNKSVESPGLNALQLWSAVTMVYHQDLRLGGGHLKAWLSVAGWVLWVLWVLSAPSHSRDGRRPSGLCGPSPGAPSQHPPYHDHSYPYRDGSSRVP